MSNLLKDATDSYYERQNIIMSFKMGIISKEQMDELIIQKDKPKSLLEEVEQWR